MRGLHDRWAGGLAPLRNPSVNAYGVATSLYKGGFVLYFFGSLAKGDSPQCGEMSRSDRGDGRQLGAVTK